MILTKLPMTILRKLILLTRLAHMIITVLAAIILMKLIIIRALDAVQEVHELQDHGPRLHIKSIICISFSLSINMVLSVYY